MVNRVGEIRASELRKRSKYGVQQQPLHHVYDCVKEFCDRSTIWRPKNSTNAHVEQFSQHHVFIFNMLTITRRKSSSRENDVAVVNVLKYPHKVLAHIINLRKRKKKTGPEEAQYFHVRPPIGFI